MPAPDPGRWTPPADFVPVDSSVEGVQLWAPRPPEEDGSAHALQLARCPQCGGAAAFDAGVGALTCRFCGFVAEARAKVVGTAAAQNEFTLEAMAAFEQGFGVERRELTCGQCGAVLAVEAGSITATCPFCASNQMNVQAATTSGIRPRYLIPFSVPADKLQANLTRYLGEGWMFPSDLAPLAQVERFSGIYLPFWVFDARIDGVWRAEIGYPHTVHYTSNGKSKTRTEIRYRWEGGSAQDVITGQLVPGTTRISARLAERLGFDLSALVEYAPSFLAGWRAMTYDLALPEAWNQGRTRMRDRSRDTNYANARSRTGYVRSFTMVADFEDERWRYVLLPMYVAAYRYGDRTCQVLVNGQTGEVSGQKPVAWWKISAAIVAAATPSFFVGVCLGVPLTLVGGLGIVVMILGFAMFVGALYWGWGLWHRALDAEAA